LAATTFNLRFTQREHVKLIDSAFNHLNVRADNPVDVTIDMFQEEDQIVLTVDQMYKTYCNQSDQLVPCVKRVFLAKTISRSGAALAVHAGVVANRAGCLILPGASGTGKTTLTAALTKVGFLEKVLEKQLNGYEVARDRLVWHNPMYGGKSRQKVRPRTMLVALNPSHLGDSHSIAVLRKYVRGV
jgi:hypothetical protein